MHAFGETLGRLKSRIEAYISLLERNIDADSSRRNKRNLDAESGDTLQQGEISEEDAFLEELSEDDAPALDYKYMIKVRHLNINEFLTDLYYDKMVLDDLYAEVTTILKEKRDNKLQTLKTVIKNKIDHTPFNAGNRKILIFTAFADTARYLYTALTPDLTDRIISQTDKPVTIAMINGTDKPRVSNSTIEKSFDAVLSAFSPRSRIKVELPLDKQVDILIGTDCISEGQNLQDCDCVINYDIQWNPVSLIQRFGRIDRIGSTNNAIKMINFFPDIALNEYLSLEKR